ncbi:hypothetical protein TIFTF001_007714 [Ficus carica]|uniref:Uncharacterized protein n=1 Tax=Ficus carica TaxID=3494 RepID=A0AA87ZQQ2_FICCA|nr:hypothetical protein TIFTF001_007714 [Ficus carica]
MSITICCYWNLIRDRNLARRQNRDRNPPRVIAVIDETWLMRLSDSGRNHDLSWCDPGVPANDVNGPSASTMAGITDATTTPAAGCEFGLGIWDRSRILL